MHQVSITHYQTLQHQRLIFNQKKEKQEENLLGNL